MKWERLHGVQFGGVRDREINPGPGLVVLEGENEAGKTMLLKMSTGLLFGYERNKDERIRMICRGCSSARIEGDLRMEDGSLVTIRRTLEEKKAYGEVLRDGTASDIRDMPLQEVSGMTREFYRSVYALTQDEMGFPQKDTWKVIRSRIFEGQITDDLRPAQEVADELKRDALAVWRPDRRGKPELDRLTSRKEDLSDALVMAEKRQEDIRKAQEREVFLAEEYEELEKKISETETTLMIDRTASEISERKSRIDQLRARAGDVSPYASISHDPMEEYDALCEVEDAAARRLSDAEDALKAARLTAASMTPEEAEILKKEDKLRLLPGAQENLTRSTRQRQSLAWDARSEHMTGEGVMREYMTESVPWEKVEAVDSDAVEEAQDKVTLAEEAVEEADQQPESNNLILLVTGGALAAAAAVLLILTYAGPLKGTKPIAALIVGLVAIGCLTVGIQIGNKSRKEKEKKVMEAIRDLKAAQREVTDLLKGLPLKTGVDPVSAIQRMKEAKARCDAADDMVRQADERIASDKELFGASGGIIPVAMDPSSAEAVELATQRLEDALETRRRVNAANAELPQREEEVKELRLTLEKAASRREAFEKLMYSLKGADMAACAEILAERRGCAASADTLEADMARSMPDWEEELERAREREAVVGKASEDSRRELRARQEEIKQEQGEVREKIRTLSGGETPAEVKGALLQLESEIDEMAKERDRTALVLGLIRAAEKRYRKENQPELLKIAEEYLSVITDGRYAGIAFIEDRDGVSVFCREENRWIDPEHEELSRGTVEQLYMALRLALIDRMDPEGETMPLFMDETLINWDARRMRGCIRLLGKVAQRRQILLMTCHSWLPQALREENIEFNHIRLVRSVRKIAKGEV